MRVSIYSDGDIFLAKTDDGHYAVGSSCTISWNLSVLLNGTRKNLPCVPQKAGSKSWDFLLREEPKVFDSLMEAIKWLS